MPIDVLTDAIGRAQAACSAERWGECGGICEDVLRLAPGHPVATGLLGVARLSSGRVEEAYDLLTDAVAADPETAVWHSNLGAALRRLGRYEDAVRVGMEAVRLSPDTPGGYINYALALEDLEQYKDAKIALVKALGISHDDVYAHIALSQLLLAAGDYEAGWREYEYVTPEAHKRDNAPRLTSMKWNGMPLTDGGIILAIADQGYGDVFQFARYLPLVRERCSNMIIGCSPEMAPMLSRFGECYSKWADIPGHAAHVHLSALPGLFHTTIDTIPTTPYLDATIRKTVEWRERLPKAQTLVGLCWQGRTTHTNNARRSMDLDLLLPLMNMEHQGLPQPLFVSLQKPWTAPPSHYFPHMVEFTDRLTDWAETAALMSNLDLVITIDTGVAHMAGALGVPVWVMLPKVCDWRWLRDRTDSPWYPTARLFRQPVMGSWFPVIQDVKHALVEFCRRGSVRTDLLAS